MLTDWLIWLDYLEENNCNTYFLRLITPIVFDAIKCNIYYTYCHGHGYLYKKGCGTGYGRNNGDGHGSGFFYTKYGGDDEDGD